MARKFNVIASTEDGKATAALRAIKKFRKRVDARDINLVAHVAAGCAIDAKESRFIAPLNRYGSLAFDVCKTLQGAADTGLMHHIGHVTIIEIAPDLTATRHTIEAV
jgi:hypothetical protein